MKARGAFALCLPALLALAAVAGFPLLRTAWLSLTAARLGVAGSARWLGAENFGYLLRDPDWWRAVRNTCVFALLSVALETVAGLALALLLDSRIRGRGALRAVILVPWAIPAVVCARIWAWMLNDLYGVVNGVLLRLHLIRAPVAWLAEDRLALGVLVVVDAWKSTPFMALLLLAGLQGIPTSVREAARLDGASPWRELIGITLPLLRPALLVALVFRTLDALRVFDLPYVLTSASRATQVVSVYARQQLVDFQDLGYGSAASLLIFCLTAVFAIAYLAAGRDILEERS